MLGLIRMAILEIWEAKRQIRKGQEMLRGLDRPIGRRKKRYSKAGAR